MKTYSQHPNRQETVTYLNKIGGDSLRFQVKGAQITISFFTPTGNLMREDVVQSVDLDTIGRFEPLSSLLYVNCLSAYQGCVTRTLTVQKIKRQYDRISLPVHSESLEPMRKALVHLIKMLSIRNYHDEVLLP
jgi:hypothetical protein